MDEDLQPRARKKRRPKVVPRFNFVGPKLDPNPNNWPKPFQDELSRAMLGELVRKGINGTRDVPLPTDLLLKLEAEGFPRHVPVPPEILAQVAEERLSKREGDDVPPGTQ